MHLRQIDRNLAARFDCCSSFDERMPRLLGLATAIALLSGAPAASPAPPTAAELPAHRHIYAGLALAPAADRWVAVESDEIDDSMEDPHRKVVVRSTGDGRPRLTLDPCATCAYGDPTFSPDGRQIAFLGRDRKAGVTHLYLATADHVTLRTTVSGVAERPRFSPDGSKIALQVVIGAHKEIGATQAAAAQVGEIGETFDEQRIAVLSVAGEDGLRLVSPDDTFVYEYDWTPDGKGFVATAAKGDGDNNWWVADLQAVDLATGTMRRIARPKDQLNAPHVSPDGRQVAYIGGLMSDFGSVGGDVYLAPFAGGEAVNLTPGFAGSFDGLTWRGGRIIATALMSDHEAVVAIDPAGRKTTVLWSQPISLEAGEGHIALDARGERMAAVTEDFGHPQEVAFGSLRTFGLGARLTDENRALKPVGVARSLEWVSEGRKVQGWLIAPDTVVPGKAYPMIVTIHGGPSAAVRPGFPSSGFRGGGLRRLLQAGYYVFEPNPRGSYGQGEDFTRANYRDFGGGDLRDILAGIDAVEKVAPVDDKRLGVYGHSYGGFMTMWTVTHSHRFATAVAGAGIGNWISYYGQNGIDQWMIPFFGASAYDDPDIYRKLSPLETVKTAVTPTFIYVGERDVECPAAQSVEFWHALKAVGVKTKLLILEGEGHGIRKPEHVKQLSEAELGWFAQYLKPGS